MALVLHNSLTKKDEEFRPRDPGSPVGVYTCGPTVYSFVTVGNWRTYVLSDVAVRVLRYCGHEVRYYMNMTDVGHLSGDNAGDADTGEDRMETAKKKEGKNAWDIALFYEEDFKRGYRLLGLTPPEKFLRATDHIAEQIALVEALEKKGLAYVIDDGVYFDTTAYERLGFHYGELSDLDRIMAGARVELNPQKRNPRDFALWKFSPADAKRDMEWPSPWGVGFPGWHIECSAMSMKYLGEQFDLHIGGEDLKSTHHPNEIAQAQGASGKSPFVNYWLHGAFLLVDGGRMGKSLGNAYTLADLESRGISPRALRYFYFSGHYRSPLNFTWEGLAAAAQALTRLEERFLSLPEGGSVSPLYQQRFLHAVEDDLNMPQALAVIWELLKDESVLPADKRATLLDLDRIFGFGLKDLQTAPIPPEIAALAKERDSARQEKDWAKSDELRKTLEENGYEVRDEENGTFVVPKIL